MQASVVAATIAQDSSIGNQGGSSNLQRFESHHPPTLKGGGDPMVVIHCFRIVRKDMGASDKRKESQPSSSFKKKQKTSASHESQGLGRGHQGQGQGQSFRGGRHFSAPSQLGKMKCYHYHHPRHKRRDCPQRQGSIIMRHHSLKLPWDTHRCNLFLLIPTWAKGTNVSPRARIGVEARTSRPVLQRPRGVSTS